MPAPSLREIELLLSQLWLQTDAREKFFGSKSSAPDSLRAQVDRNGVELYASLLQFGQQDLMVSIYPYSAKLLKQKWEPTVDSYFRKYPPAHFHLNAAGRQFKQYLIEDEPQLIKSFPFLPELADYEWIEMEVIEKNVDFHKLPNLVLSEPDHFIKYRPILNPALVLRKYKYQIEKIAKRVEQGQSLRGVTKPETTFVACLRDPETNKTFFLDLSELPFELLQAVSDAPHSYAELAKLTVSRLADASPEKGVSTFLEINEQLQNLSVFVGSQRIDQSA